jgi:hypothetical protein
MVTACTAQTASGGKAIVAAALPDVAVLPTATAITTGDNSLTRITLKLVAEGFSAPVGLAAPADGTHRLFVVEQMGRIRVIRDDVILDIPFLDISSRISCCVERGLLRVG